MTPELEADDADSEEEQYHVRVPAVTEVTVTAETRSDAIEKAVDQTDTGDLHVDGDECSAERPLADDEKRFDVYKNGEKVEENKPMTDAKANRLDGHTQYNKDEGDFERFTVEEVETDD